MKCIRRALATVIVALSFITSAPASAASFSTDQSDLWWTDPPGSENGWGIQLVQNNSTIFATMFVYGPAEFGAFTITQNGAAVTIFESIVGGGSCTYSGTYSQAGRFGAVNGTYQCSNGSAGNFGAFEFEVNISRLTGRFVANSQACSNVQGRLGGLRSTRY